MLSLRKIKQKYESSLKSTDTEETIDLYFYRPLGFVWALIAEKLHIHPNAITIASIFLGVGAGVMFYFTPLWMNIIGMLLLIWANSFDSADGQLARITGQYSRIGRILDGLSGDLWFLAIYIAICLREVHTSGYFTFHHWAIWIMALVAGISHAKQAAVADLYRQFHLYFIKGEKGSELDNSYQLKRQLAEIPKHRFWSRLTITYYIAYTLQQEATTPAMQQLLKVLHQHWPQGNYPQWLRDDFRSRSLPLMKYTNILTFNWRSIILFASLFARMPWLYFASEIIIFNLIMIYMIYRHEKMCRQLISAISTRHETT